ncbi:MAG: MotA/TolQ/ExbB proton channel family protein [Planctomycetota bacterium]|jgi:biopolymer transport protein ExbB
MFKSFSLTVLILFAALVLVLAVIVVTTGIRAGKVGEEGVRSQTFFEQFVIAGGPIVWFVLLPMSLIMVYLTAEYAFTIRRKRLFPGQVGQTIIETVKRFGPGGLQSRLGEGKDFVSAAVVRSVTQGRGDWFRMRNLVFESLEEQALHLLRKVEWVNLIGNVSPMVGLFGTVFGMIKLFNAIVLAGGQPQPAQLAEGISIALVTTFWGLLIAIPALAIHGVFRNRIETLVSEATAEAERILPEIARSLRNAGGPVRPVRQGPARGSEIREVSGKPSRSYREAESPR